MRTSPASWITLALSLVSCRASAPTDPRAPLDSIVVRVVDATTHAPVAGATVSYVTREALEPEGIERMRRVWYDSNMQRSAVERRVTTDERGEARLEAPLEARSYRQACAVWASLDDSDPDSDPETDMRCALRAFGIEASCGERFATLPIDRELATVETLELRPAEFVDVRVVDGSGRPVGWFPVHVRAFKKLLSESTISRRDDDENVVETTTTQDEDEDLYDPYDPYEVWTGTTDAETGLSRIGPLDRIRARGLAGSKLEATLIVYGMVRGVIRERLSLTNGARLELRVPGFASLDVEVVDPDGRAVECEAVEIEFFCPGFSKEVHFFDAYARYRTRVVGIRPGAECTVRATAPGWREELVPCTAPERAGETQHVRVQLRERVPVVRDR